MLASLSRQSLLALPGYSLRVLVLANGCNDATAAVARTCPIAQLEVAELPLPGKSRSWNRFVHDLSRSDADSLIFCDADIELPDPDTLHHLIEGLSADPELSVINSRPVKDLSYHPQKLRLVERLIAAGAAGLDDWQTAICGQLYAMPATRARRVHLPIGLPVEDGFLRAMVVTDALTRPEEDLTRINGAEAAFHIYASERKIGALLQHHTRIIVGSAINDACFAYLNTLPAGERQKELGRAAADEHWLARVIGRQLPRFPYGFVRPHFALKRLRRACARPRRSLRPKPAAMLLIGFSFDLIVFARAQIRMARGSIVGFW